MVEHVLPILFGSGLLIFALVGCRPAANVLPTVAPTLIWATASPITTSMPTLPSSILSTAPAIQLVTNTPTAVPTASLTADYMPLALPTDLPFPSVPISDPTTIPPPNVVNSSGTLTITLTTPQLNQALTRAFAEQPLPGFSEPPLAVLIEGGLELTLKMSASILPIRLTLTLAALPTTMGKQLDLRAVGLTALNGVTTLQVKRAQALLADILTAVMQQAAASTRFDVTYVSVTPSIITLTLVTY